MTEREGEADEALILRCKEAPEDEVRGIVGELARRHHGAIVSFIHGIVADGTAAEDLAQETFVRVYRHAREFQAGAAKFTTWLFTIARNLSLNEVRDRKKRARLTLDAPVAGGEGDEEATVATIASRAESPGEIAARHDLSDVVRAAVMGLPEAFRHVLVLCDLEQLSYEECSEALAVPIGTVRSRLSRARIQLSEKLRAKGSVT